jgi:hypothetical protein
MPDLFEQPSAHLRRRSSVSQVVLVADPPRDQMRDLSPQVAVSIVWFTTTFRTRR